MGIKIHYRFDLESGKHRELLLELDPQSLTLTQPKPAEPAPTWTELEVGKCIHCPLTTKTTTHCPVARNLDRLVELFKDEVAHHKAKITVTTDERSYVKENTVQSGLYSIFGVIMATSGCPKMNFLKPMARYHLPFATAEETILRSVSYFLLGTFLSKQNDGKAEIDLKNLDTRYADIQKVNQGIMKRIQSVKKTGDASPNSITTLDCFSKLLNMALQRNLQSLKTLFGSCYDS